nr:hypothetical protein [uncultured Chryseobacterium sp.]
MELPFYLNFREFEKNYYNNLELWFEEYYNTSEIDFLKSLAALYKPYLSYSFSGDILQADASVQVKNCFFSSLENYGISFNIDDNSKNSKTQISQVSEPKIISMMEYAQCILDKINAYFHKHQMSMKENENILDYLNHYEIITLKEKNGYCLDYDLHQKTLPFLKAYLPRFGNTVDMSVYSDFYFSVVKIADFIDSKLNAVEAFEKSIYSELKSESMIRIHMRNQNFLTICN